MSLICKGYEKPIGITELSENLGRDCGIEETYWRLSKLCWRSDCLSYVVENKVIFRQCPNSAKGNETTFKVINWKVEEDRVLFS